ncbi:tetraacyldisaccharide 4'-kinase [Bacteriovoracaceae bacterium]|nr:tetraacyldisaccharide 4'-kinase [Bacteriovoracaceae bacterium]
MNRLIVLLNILLFPLSKIWEFAYALRRAFYDYGLLKKEIFQVPVISIGNLTFGGTGKTPFIIYLSKYFQEIQKVPVILTRGYKGELEDGDGIIFADKKFKANPVEYGDEPLLIARRLRKGAVIVGKKRSQNLKKYFHQVRPDIVLLDDGYQHIQIFRSFNVALFDATLPINRYKVAPMGYLREGLSALGDADAIVISRCDLASDENIENLENLIAPYHHHKIPVAKIKYLATGIFDIYYNKIYEIDELKGVSVIAAVAIASPESFFAMLDSFGVNIVHRAIYPDHYYFTKDDVNSLLRTAAENSAIVITSEKDLVKIRKITQDVKITFVNIEVDFISGEREFLTQVNKRLSLESNHS